MASLDDIRDSLPFFDSVQAGITLLDSKLNFLWGNRFFREELAELPGLCGKHCFVGYVPSDRRCEDCLPPQVIRTGRVAETMRTAQGEDGSLSYFRVIVAPMGEDDALLCTLILPISPRDMGQMDAWRERFLLSAIRNGNDGVIALDRTHTVRFWNRGAEKIFGLDVTEAVGAPIHRLMGKRNWELAREVFSPGDPLLALDNRELKVESSEGQDLWIDVSRTPLIDGSGRPNGYSFVIRDITERKLAEEKMAFTERMTAVGNMAAALAHEIGTPLGVISNTAEYLMLDMDEDDARREELDAIVRETDRIGGLVRELLSYSRPEVPEMDPLRMEEVISRVQRLIYHASEKQGTQLRLRVDPELPPVFGDANQLEQVVLNLCMNALQSVDSGGEVKMMARQSCPIGPDGHEHLGLEIVVEDTGPGVPLANLPKLFDPFFTTKVNGTGLGLSVCKTLVEEHGGTISVYNRPEGGTGFTVWLPALDADAPDAEGREGGSRPSGSDS
jgi:PAS domain S-box-containing protein